MSVPQRHPAPAPEGQPRKPTRPPLQLVGHEPAYALPAATETARNVAAAVDTVLANRVRLQNDNELLDDLLAQGQNAPPPQLLSFEERGPDGWQTYGTKR